VTVQAGTELLLDQSAALGKITVFGKLSCDLQKEVEIMSTGIHVMGTGSAFSCGTPSRPHLGKLHLKLKGDSRLAQSHGGERVIMAMQGGQLEWHGTPKTPYARLNSTITKGTKELNLTSFENWKVGDVLAISTTSFNRLETERVKIASVQGTRVTLAEPVAFSHWGEIQSYKHPHRGFQTYDARAVVANLTRSIHIQPQEADTASLNEIGVHIMVMANSAAFIQNVEISRAGQAGILGRYPFHWHLANNVDGQYFDNNSLYDSFQRCVTIHGTHGARVQNNVCVEHKGHGYFLENGNETRNILKGNVSMTATRPESSKALLQSDIDVSTLERFPGPSSFWISHPSNTVENNFAIGSQGTGFWMAFVNALKCQEDQSCTVVTDSAQGNVFPTKSNTTAFHQNVAFSNVVGMNWDGAPLGAPTQNPRQPEDRLLGNAHYWPNVVPVFKGLQNFKNLSTGIYFRGQRADFVDGFFGDNARVGAFFAYNQILVRNLIVGKSKFVREEDVVFAARNFGFDTWTGVRNYDGATELRQVHFADYPSAPLVFEGTDYTPTPIYHVGGNEKFPLTITQASFATPPYRLAYHRGKHSHFLSSAIYDLDGSFAGKAKSYLIPSHPFTTMASKCSPLQTDTQHHSCQVNLGLFQIWYREPDVFWNFKYRVVRSDGAQINNPVEEVFDRKFNLIYDQGFQYKIIFEPNQDLGQRSRFRTQSVNPNQVSPIIQIEGLNDCILQANGAKEVSNLSDLSGLKESVYKPGPAGSIEIVFVTRHASGLQSSENVAKWDSGFVDVSCK
jgi:hypothetical protein